MRKYEYADVIQRFNYLRYDLMSMSINYADPLPLLLARVEQVFDIADAMLKTDLTPLQRIELKKLMRESEKDVDKLVYRKYL